jgi:hypothetical protein
MAKIINFSRSEGLNEYEPSGIGIQWMHWRDDPPMTIFREHQDYWSFFTLVFAVVNKRWALEIRLRKQPYRSKAQYLAWRRAREKGLILSRADLDQADELAKLNPSISDQIAARVERARQNKN